MDDPDTTGARGEDRNEDALAELRASEEKYRRIADNISDVIWIADLDFRVTYVTPSVERLVGEPPEAYLERPLEEKFPPESLATLRAVLAEELETERGPACDRGRSRVIEVQHYRADGSPVWVSMHVSFLRDDEGRPTALQGVTRDVTERKRLEQSLVESERKWRNVLVETPQVGISLDPQARIVFANAHFLQLTGWTEDEVLGCDWFETFIPAGIQDEVRGVFDAVVSSRDTEGFTSFENEILTRAGELRTIAWSNVVTKDVHGDVVDVTCLGIDLTERARAEQRSRQLSDIVDSSLDEIYVFDAESLRFRYANRGALRNLQYSREEIEQLTPVDLKPAFTNTSFRAAIAPLLSGERESLTFETVHRRADGSRYPVEARLQLMESEGDRVFLAVIFDTTERTRAEAALRESEERYRLLVENANELVLMAQNGRIAFVNRRAVGFLGYTPEELVGQPFVDYVHPDDREQVAKNYRLRLAGEELPEVYPFRILHRSGETRWVEIGAVRVEWKGRPATLNFLLDITERTRAEDERRRLQAQLLQAQKMESIGRLAGGVAHDFNNMLAVILARTELMLLDLPPGDPGREDLEEVQRAATRSAELTRQLLAFARKQTISPRVLDLNETVEGMLRMLGRLIGEDLELVWRPAARVWPVKVDPAQVDQVLANLCVNARDAIAGTGRVTIEIENVDVDPESSPALEGVAPGRYVLLAVSDDGCGMDEEVLSHLFEPFFTTKERGKGTGLGLAMVFGIVTQNEGFIRVESEVGRGTAVRVYLPRHAGDAPEPSTLGRAEPPASRGETVLLVEDDPGLLGVGAQMLQRLGYTVLTADGPARAAVVVREHAGPIHLLMTDVVMPQMNGRELAELVKGVRPEIQVLFMSGYTADVVAHRGILDDDVQLIEKPFSMGDLAAKMREALHRSR